MPSKLSPEARDAYIEWSTGHVQEEKLWKYIDRLTPEETVDWELVCMEFRIDKSVLSMTWNEASEIPDEKLEPEGTIYPDDTFVKLKRPMIPPGGAEEPIKHVWTNGTIEKEDFVDIQLTNGKIWNLSKNRIQQILPPDHPYHPESR